MYNHKIKTSFLARAFSISGLKKPGFNHIIVLLNPLKAVYNTMREITNIFFFIGARSKTICFFFKILKKDISLENCSLIKLFKSLERRDKLIKINTIIFRCCARLEM